MSLTNSHQLEGEQCDGVKATHTLTVTALTPSFLSLPSAPWRNSIDTSSFSSSHCITKGSNHLEKASDVTTTKGNVCFHSRLRVTQDLKLPFTFHSQFCFLGLTCLCFLQSRGSPLFPGGLRCMLLSSPALQFPLPCSREA